MIARPRIVPVILVASVALVAAACSNGASGEGSPAEDSAAATVMNCGHAVAFEAPPERVVLFRNEVVPVLSSLGVLDRVVGLVGQFHEEYLDEETAAQLQQLPVLSGDISTVGGGEISLEDVLAVEPDLVVGTSETVTREALLAQGVQVMENEESCEGSQATSTLEDVDTLIEMYGAVFDRKDEAEAAVTALGERVDEAIAAVSAGEDRTAAMLYPTMGGGPAYAYGSGSMNHTLLELAGFTNVFADTEDRTFEVSTEELLDRDPDVLILLHSGADPADVEAAVASLPGADTLTAVQDGALMPMLFGFTSPASPITIDGLALIVQRFAE